MPRSQAVAIENNFQRALITEASGLNFPENACTETYDCHFEVTGQVSRRLGFDFESNHGLVTIDRESDAISTYLWRNVAGDGNISLFVAQVGDTLYFWDVSQSQSLSQGDILDTVVLTDFDPAGAPNPRANECQFTDGNGYLFVTHPNLEPFYVSYDSSTQNFTATQIDIEIRDFQGLNEAVAVDNRPNALTATHNYNLQNQGWTASSYAAQTSATSVTPGLGSKGPFTVSGGGPWAANDAIFAWSKKSYQGDSSGVPHYIQGSVASYAGTSLTITSTAYNGTSAVTDWQFSSKPDHIQIFQHVVGKYPSNADVWWLFKNADEEFDPKKTIVHVDRGTTPAPKGHFILDAFNQDRTTASGISGLTTVTTSYFRPTTAAFHAGRVFYAGVPYAGYSGNVYFTQIIEPGSTSQFGKCYQKNDPTSETLFELLPDDGGIIVIPEAGTIYKLWSIQGGLVVFGSNGVWHISGSTGIGFTASDYTVRRISTIKSISGTSFIDIGGYPAWWTAEGIYILQPSQDGLKLESLTDSTIFTFYSDIPITSKRQARGFFNLVTRQAQWLYRSEAAGTVEEIYEYDRILNFNTKTGALFPWTISESDVKIHAAVCPESFGGSLVENQVINDAADTVVDDSGNNVISYQTGGTTAIAPVFKYFASYLDGSDYKFTFCEENSESYTDFETYEGEGAGIDYTSYFITGFKIHGQAQRKWQTNYLYIYVNEIPSEYNFQAIWNYANTGDSGDWSSQQHQSVVNENTQYDLRYNRLKIRGEGVALQFKVFSEPGEPFSIVGWSGWETSNANP
jgi:hypothetical protein